MVLSRLKDLGSTAQSKCQNAGFLLRLPTRLLEVDILKNKLTSSLARSLPVWKQTVHTFYDECCTLRCVAAIKAEGYESFM